MSQKETIYVHLWKDRQGKTAPEFDKGDSIEAKERLLRAGIRLRKAGCRYVKTFIYNDVTEELRSENWGALCV